MAKIAKGWTASAPGWGLTVQAGRVALPPVSPVTHAEPTIVALAWRLHKARGFVYATALALALAGYKG